MVPGHFGKKITKANHKEVLSHLKNRDEEQWGSVSWTEVTFYIHSRPEQEAGCGLNASQRIVCPSSKWPSQLCISFPFSCPGWWYVDGHNKTPGTDFMCPSLGIRIQDHATWLPSNFNYLETFSLERFSMQIVTAVIRELLFSINYGFPWRLSKESAWNTGKTWVRSLCQEDPLEKGMTTHSNILAWEIP